MIVPIMVIIPLVMIDPIIIIYSIGQDCRQLLLLNVMHRFFVRLIYAKVLRT